MSKRANHSLLVVASCALLFLVNPAFAEDDGSVMRTLIPAVAFDAAYVGWRRVATDNHYTVDVVAGAAIGVASSLIFTRAYKGLVVAPLADNGFYGLTVSKQW